MEEEEVNKMKQKKKTSTNTYEIRSTPTHRTIQLNEERKII